MNNYYSSSLNDYSYEYYSPYSFYSSPVQSMHTPPASYSYYQQQPQIFSSPVQQHTNIDRTPLRRHQCFKKNDLQILHQIYNQDSYPSNDALQQLALELKVSIDKIRQWFKNRRHSDKLKKKRTSIIS